MLFRALIFPLAFFTSVILLAPPSGLAQQDFDREPINYSKSTPTDPVHQLMQQLASGEKTLQWDKKHGYLKSLLSELNVPTESQSLVFTKTSLQVSRISPRRPRAVYFNDDVYVGWVQRGDVIELSAADPKLGATFYSLSQKRSDQPKIKRETHRCLQCHGGVHTRGIPGHIVRSVIPERTGQAAFHLGTNLVDDKTPLNQRFGGWYVSGTHGELRHRGNAWLKNPGAKSIDVEAGANVSDLSKFFNTSKYLTPHSDLIAQMVLQHQAHMHNVITRTNFQAQTIAQHAKTMNKLLERDSDFVSESTNRRYLAAAEKVIEALLFCGEFELTSTLEGTSDFKTQFESQGPFDEDGRSLRAFDLENRLFRYPCSFLVYSDAFAALPEPVLTRVYQRLDEVLSGEDQSKKFSHLSADDRTAIAEILEQTGIKFRVDQPKK